MTAALESGFWSQKMGTRPSQQTNQYLNQSILKLPRLGIETSKVQPLFKKHFKAVDSLYADAENDQKKMAEQAQTSPSDHRSEKQLEQFLARARSDKIEILRELAEMEVRFANEYNLRTKLRTIKDATVGIQGIISAFSRSFEGDLLLQQQLVQGLKEVDAIEEMFEQDLQELLTKQEAEAMRRQSDTTQGDMDETKERVVYQKVKKVSGVYSIVTVTEDPIQHRLQFLIYDTTRSRCLQHTQYGRRDDVERLVEKMMLETTDNGDLRLLIEEGLEPDQGTILYRGVQQLTEGTQGKVTRVVVGVVEQPEEGSILISAYDPLTSTTYGTKLHNDEAGITPAMELEEKEDRAEAVASSLELKTTGEHNFLKVVNPEMSVETSRQRKRNASVMSQSYTWKILFSTVMRKSRRILMVNVLYAAEARRIKIVMYQPNISAYHDKVINSDTIFDSSADDDDKISACQAILDTITWDVSIRGSPVPRLRASSFS
eukprot:GILJ01013720.1.p1 GENE.GILJ01013720.1~~GILJ01013720.1.p1  ORF type:complete len:488 (-),score=70.37 GILJ01013720.1:222-1685(-)